MSITGTPTPRSERTREALRRTAIRHFVEHGFEAANVPAIAAEVGVTERTFYRHFATKDEVLFIDVTTGLEWFRTAVAERLDAGDALDVAVRTAITTPPTDPRLMIEMARLRTQLLSPARIERSFREAQATMARYLREVLQDRGADDALATAVRAETASGAVFAALAVWIESGGKGGLDRIAVLTRAALDQVKPAL